MTQCFLFTTVHPSVSLSGMYQVEHLGPFQQRQVSKHLEAGEEAAGHSAAVAF